MFQNKIPQSIIWKNKAEIISIINRIGAEPELTHLFLPYGGGIDLPGAKDSYEKDCIEFPIEKLPLIVRPNYLVFESFADDYEWAYFRLETLELHPIGVYDFTPIDKEFLTELSPLEYDDQLIWEKGFVEFDEYGNEIPLPVSARLVTRILSGSLVIFAKASKYYNQLGTYEGIHNKYSAASFRKYIEDAKVRF